MTKREQALKNLEQINGSRTPEERRLAASKAGQASRKKRKVMRELAVLINEGPAPTELVDKMRACGLEDEDLTGAAAVVYSVYRSALAGDMRAVDKWERLVGQGESTEENGMLLGLIAGLQR